MKVLDLLRLVPRHGGLLLLLAAGVAAGWLLRGGLAPAVAPPMTTGEGAHTTAAPTTWTCAMHPQIQLPEPGDCPICGMELVPLGGERAEGLREITVSPVARERMRIETYPVERRFVDTEVRMVGKIDYDEQRVETITARVPGRLERLFVDFVGIEVTRGDHLVDLFSPKLYAAQTELLQSLEAERRRAAQAEGALHATAGDNLDAARERLLQLGLTEQQIAEVEESGTPSDHITLFAPIGGIVVQKEARPGMYVQEGTVLYTIADLRHLWVVLDAYETDLGWLHYGQRVEFTTEAYPGEVFEGTVAFIDPVLDDRTRTVKVRVNVENPRRQLKPDMFVKALVRTTVAADGRVLDPDLVGRWICPMDPEVVRAEPGTCNLCEMDLVTTESLGYFTVRPEEAEKPLVIPASAPLVTGKRAVVYVEREDAEEPTFEGREIVLGPRAGDWYVVRSGLAEGELVVTNGNFKLDSALEIRASPSMMSPEGGAGGGAHRHGPAHAGGAVEGPGRSFPASERERLEAVVESLASLSRARELGDLAELRAAFGALGDALVEIDEDAFSGPAHAAWRELSMHLLNDAVEGEDVATREDADHVIALLERHLERLAAGLELPFEVGFGR